MSAVPPAAETQAPRSPMDDEYLDPRHVPLGPASGVRRVNSLPLLIISVGLVAFCLLIALALLDRAGTSRSTVAEAQSTVVSGENSQKAPGMPAVLTEAPAGIIEAQLSEPKVPQTPLSGLVATTDEVRSTRSQISTSAGTHAQGLPQVPAPSGPLLARPSPDPSVEHERAMRALEERLRVFAERAKASSVMPFRTEQPAAVPPTASPPAQDDIAYRLAEIRRTLDQSTAENSHEDAQDRRPGPGAPRPSTATTIFPAGVTESRSEPAGSDIHGTPSTDRWRLASGWEAPRSSYELRAGSVIPALALTTIRSELPGQVMAQVSTDVYDTATGMHRVIPQGTRLVGRYASDVMFGQKTLFVAWQRLIRPDGFALDLGSMPAAQAAGATGLSDEVDNHYLRLFGSALLLSGVTAGIAYSANPAQSHGQAAGTRPTARETLSEAVGQQLGQVTAQLLVKNMNVSPTLEIRPGYRFAVLVTKDIDFTPPTQRDVPRR